MRGHYALCVISLAKQDGLQAQIWPLEMTTARLHTIHRCVIHLKLYQTLGKERTSTWKIRKSQLGCR